MSNELKQEKLRDKLIRELGIIHEPLEDDRVIEIMLNPDGSLWIERLGEDMTFFGNIQRSQAETIIYTVSTYLGQVIDLKKPTLEGELPIGNARIACSIPPIVKAPVFTIRKHAIKVFTLKDYLNQNLITESQCRILIDSIRNRKNIIVCGGTQSGKTTFTNALINEISIISPNHRIVIIEDTAEVKCSAKNFLSYSTSEYTNISQIMTHIFRHRPDRIIIGEVRGGETLTLLKAWISGHPGGICTVHADDSRIALFRIEQLVGEAVSPLNPQLLGLIGEAIDLIINIRKVGKVRRIHEILSVQGYNGKSYDISPIADHPDHSSDLSGG